MDIQRLGHILRECRVRADLKQEYMALVLDVNQSFISKVENGERPLNTKQLLCWLSVAGQEHHFVCELAKEMAVFEIEHAIRTAEIFQQIQTLVGAGIQTKMPL